MSSAFRWSRGSFVPFSRRRCSNSSTQFVTVSNLSLAACNSVGLHHGQPCHDATIQPSCSKRRRAALVAFVFLDVYGALESVSASQGQVERRVVGVRAVKRKKACRTCQLRSHDSQISSANQRQASDPTVNA